MSENDEKNEELHGAHFEGETQESRPAPSHMAEQEPADAGDPADEPAGPAHAAPAHAAPAHAARR